MTLACSAVSPVGRVPICASISASVFLSALVSFGLVRSFFRRSRSPSSSGGRALSSPNRSLVRIWSTRQLRMVSTSFSMTT
jgi:hypothetical protein